MPYRCSFHARGIAVTLLLVTMVVPASSSLAQTPKASTGQAFEALLVRLDEKAHQLRDLRADFEEHKFTKILKRPLVSKGRVTATSAGTRWETLQPFASTTVIGSSEMRIYYPDRKTVEVYPLGAEIGRLFVSPMASITELRGSYTIGPAGDSVDDPREVAIELVPRDAAHARYVRGLRIYFDRASLLVTKVVVTGSEGDRSELRFSNVRINTGMDDRVMKLDLPPETKVVFPQGGSAKSKDPGGRGKQR